MAEMLNISWHQNQIIVFAFFWSEVLIMGRTEEQQSFTANVKRSIFLLQTECDT
jgi:hypothetical protein